MAFRSTFTFNTARSDYDEVMQILNTYVEQDKLVIDKVSWDKRNDICITIFTVTCSPNDYVDILGVLMREWLLLETWNGV